MTQNGVVHTVVENYDDMFHEVTVEAQVAGEPVDAQTAHIPAGQAQQVTLRLPRSADASNVELVALPDEHGDATAEGMLSPADASHMAPDVGTVPETMAVTLFGIINGFGGAASQMLASKMVGGGGPVGLDNVIKAGLFALGGTIAGSLLLPER